MIFESLVRSEGTTVWWPCSSVLVIPPRPENGFNMAFKVDRKPSLTKAIWVSTVPLPINCSRTSNTSRLDIPVDCWFLLPPLLLRLKGSWSAALQAM